MDFLTLMGSVGGWVFVPDAARGPDTYESGLAMCSG